MPVLTATFGPRILKKIYTLILVIVVHPPLPFLLSFSPIFHQMLFRWISGLHQELMQLNLQVITLSWGGGNQLLDAFNLCLGGSSNACNRFTAIYYLILHVVLLFVRISFPIQTIKALWSDPHLTSYVP